MSDTPKRKRELNWGGESRLSDEDKVALFILLTTEGLPDAEIEIGDLAPKLLAMLADWPNARGIAAFKSAEKRGLILKEN